MAGNTGASGRVLNAATGWVVAGHVWARMRAGPAEVGQQLGDRFWGSPDCLGRRALRPGRRARPSPARAGPWPSRSPRPRRRSRRRRTGRGRCKPFRRRIAPPAPHEAVGQRAPEASRDHRHHHEAGGDLWQPSPSDLLPESPPVETNPSDDRHAARAIAMCGGHEPAPPRRVHLPERRSADSSAFDVSSGCRKPGPDGHRWTSQTKG